ncbi:hypothetical protein GCM10027053_16800 [Intrasporangium mesophilum]
MTTVALGHYCPTVTEGADREVLTVRELWPSSPSSAHGEVSVMSTHSTAGCAPADTPRRDCATGLPWIRGAKDPAHLFAETQPGSMVMGFVRGGPMPPPGHVAKTHELRYVYLDFDTALDPHAVWLAFARTCARASRPLAPPSKGRRLEFVMNGENGSPINAQLLLSASQVLWLEFDGATWASRDITRATSVALRTWPH